MRHAVLTFCLLFTGAFVLTVSGCNAQPKTSDQNLSQLEYPKLLQMQANPKVKLVIVDVRSAKRFATGHIPNAINISIPELCVGDQRLAGATDIVVYATGWTEYLSPAAAKKLLSLKYKNVHDFRGGIEMWQAYGGKITPGSLP